MNKKSAPEDEVGKSYFTSKFPILQFSDDGDSNVAG